MSTLKCLLRILQLLQISRNENTVIKTLLAKISDMFYLPVYWKAIILFIRQWVQKHQHFAKKVVKRLGIFTFDKNVSR